MSLENASVDQGLGYVECLGTSVVYFCLNSSVMSGTYKLELFYGVL